MDRFCAAAKEGTSAFAVASVPAGEDIESTMFQPLATDLKAEMGERGF